jgi:hypothetical protein
MKTSTLREYALTLKPILQFFEMEKQRVSTILNLANIGTANLSFLLPEYTDGRELGTQPTIDAIAFALKLEYTHLERTHSLPALKLGTVTLDGVPVLQLPNMSQSVGFLTPLITEDLKVQDELQALLERYKGMHPSDVFSQIATQILANDLNEQDKPTTDNIDG